MNESSVSEGTISVIGGKIWYRIVGAGKPGIPLLILHGGPGATHDYLEPLEALSDERPVVFYDQLGCGNSDRPADTALWTISRFIDEISQLREALQLKEVIILGQSWGGALAVEYMLQKQPQGVYGLILSAPLLSTSRWLADQGDWISQLPPSVKDSVKKYEILGDYTAQAYQDAMIEFYKLHLCRLDPWPDCLLRTFEKMGADVYAYMWGPSEFTVTGTLRNFDVSNRLDSIKVPTLFTCGEFDEAMPATINDFHAKVRESEFYVFKGASHSHHLEKSTEYLEVVRKFLSRCQSYY